MAWFTMRCSRSRARAVITCFGLALAAATTSAQGEPGAKRWFLKKPGPTTQISKSVAERGVNPCNTPDPGFKGYEKWQRGISMGQMILPTRGGIAANGDFDVVFHFHGHEPARKEWVQVMNGPVFVAFTLGIGSGAYENAFRDPAAFTQLLESVERAVAERHKKPRARARKIALSAWSAGYGAVEEILHQPLAGRIDSVILLDGLHCDYVAGGGLEARQLDAFLKFARKAARGEKLMVVSHSSIIPPGYASTTETANYLIDGLGGRPAFSRPRGGEPMGLELVARFDRAGFHVRGYAGNAELDHCAHLGLFRDILRVHLAPRWYPSRARRR
jgi:hypothetical protein